MSRPYSARVDRFAAAVTRKPGVVGIAMATTALAEVVVRGATEGVGILLVSVLAVATTAPVSALSHHWSAAAIMTAAAIVTLASGHHLPIASVIAIAVMFYAVGRHRSGRFAMVLLMPFVVLALVELASSSGGSISNEVVTTDEPAETSPALPHDASASPEDVDPYPILIAAVVSPSLAVGYSRRSRRTEERLEDVQAAFSHEATAHAARGERVRIARELHDVVAHRITSIAVQAETARLTTPDMSAEGARHLAAIGDNARDALAEMRRLLGVLRKDTGDDTDRHPQPGLFDIHRLIDDARITSGATVRLTVTGRMEPLDPSLELTAYRVVQESLTNARRHAKGAAVDVELHFSNEALRVRVHDTGGDQHERSHRSAVRPATTPNGHGLIGMRERVEIARGTLTTGAAPSGGFTVEATLPRHLSAHPDPGAQFGVGRG